METSGSVRVTFDPAAEFRCLVFQNHQQARSGFRATCFLCSKDAERVQLVRTPAPGPDGGRRRVSISPHVSSDSDMDIRPNHTVYINNINDKVKKEDFWVRTRPPGLLLTVLSQNPQPDPGPNVAKK
ncbi:hypothetical protein CCH79_00020120 [Gambusia affinis]|uniref:Uncharacterized protein n=1 Tax=Gambusia affinis TaxID=33528 RepID=A0A315UXB3_GAMAF|nr:hypothetical protein CCH79_00020120 [Gambusia affinis]